MIFLWGWMIRIPILDQIAVKWNENSNFQLKNPDSDWSKGMYLKYKAQPQKENQLCSKIRILCFCLIHLHSEEWWRSKGIALYFVGKKSEVRKCPATCNGDKQWTVTIYVRWAPMYLCHIYLGINIRSTMPVQLLQFNSSILTILQHSPHNLQPFLFTYIMHTPWHTFLLPYLPRLKNTYSAVI